MKENKIDDAQEYVRRAIEKLIEDDTFRNNPWLKVVNYGYLDMEEYTPIATLLPHNGLERPPLLVGIIESMSPVGGSIHYNGCFHCIVKDPTGKIGGTIHHKIMTDPKWQGKIV